MTYHRAARYGARRVYTEEEDRLIIMQSKGHMTMHRLEREIKASRESIVLRAEELGVVPVIQHHNRVKKIRIHERRYVIQDPVPQPQPGDGNDYPFNVGDDLLLKRLFQEHSNRRYEELDVSYRRKFMNHK